MSHKIQCQILKSFTISLVSTKTETRKIIKIFRKKKNDITQNMSMRYKHCFIRSTKVYEAIYEPRCVKTCFLHMQNQRRKSAAQ